MNKIGKLNVLFALFLGLQTSSSNTPSSAQTFSQKHPARAEVLRRDNHQLARDRNLNAQINHDAGHLSGHYGQLKGEDHAIARQDASIRHQEQWDAAHHGGHITPGEYHKLNQEENHVRAEENHLQHQINRDHR